MTTSVFSASQQRTARIAGFAYLIIIVAGIVAEFVIRSGLIVADDAAATARNIMESESLFRVSIALDLVMIGADLVVALALYVLLRPINRTLALGAACFRIVMDAILGLNLLNLLAALLLLNGNVESTAFGTIQRDAAALLLLDAHALGYSIGLVPFGFGTLIISYLLFVSRSVPRPVSGLLSLAALTYLIGSFIEILMPDMSESFALAYVVPLIAESTLALWLVIKGVRPEAGLRQVQSAVVRAETSSIQSEARHVATR